VIERTYWEIPVANGLPRSEDEYLDELRTLLRDSVRRRLLSEVPLGAFLSGGIDSSVVVGLMAELLDRPVQTFSVGFTVPGGYDESEHAARVARHFRADHHSLVVESMDVEHLLPQTVHSLDEPIADFAAIPTYLVSQFARRSVKVVLTGEGADELFAGYDHYRFPSLFGRYGQVPEPLRRLLSHAGRAVPARIAKALAAGALDPLGGFRLLKSVFRPPELEQVLSGDVRAQLNGVAATQPDFARLFDRGRNLDVLNRYLLTDLATWLPEDLLMKVDKMSMSVSLEARVPYLDHRIVELAATMPSDLKWRGGGKYILKRLAAGLVPREIIERPKHGFRLPLDRWFRAELRPMAEDLLLGTRARGRGLLEAAPVAALWQRYLRGDDTYFMQVWTLLNLELWCRGFLDGDALRT
jgi:asparagine synthase (glutamine-hydrolysing)